MTRLTILLLAVLVTACASIRTAQERSIFEGGGGLNAAKESVSQRASTGIHRPAPSTIFRYVWADAPRPPQFELWRVDVMRSTDLVDIGRSLVNVESGGVEGHARELLGLCVCRRKSIVRVVGERATGVSNSLIGYKASLRRNSPARPAPDYYYLTVERHYGLYAHLYGRYYVQAVEFVVDSLATGDQVIVWRTH